MLTAWKVWASAAEVELIHATGTNIPVRGKRGQPISLRWRSMLPDSDERRSKLAKPSLKRWMASRMREASTLAKAAAPEAASEAGRMLRDPGGKKLKKLTAIHDFCFKHQPVRAAEISDWKGRACHAQGKLRALLQAVSEVRLAPEHDAERLFVAWQAEIDLFDEWIADLHQEAREEIDELASDGRRQWKRWCEQAIENGGGAAHKFTRVPQKWVPTHTISTDTGVVLCDPLSLLKAEKEKFAGRWKASEVQTPLLCVPGKEALPQLPPSELRRASESFAIRSASSFDGFHMRHFAML